MPTHAALASLVPELLESDEQFIELDVRGDAFGWKGRDHGLCVGQQVWHMHQGVAWCGG
jgi:hypothetical protein